MSKFKIQSAGCTLQQCFQKNKCKGFASNGAKNNISLSLHYSTTDCLQMRKLMDVSEQYLECKEQYKVRQAGHSRSSKRGLRKSKTAL